LLFWPTSCLGPLALLVVIVWLGPHGPVGMGISVNTPFSFCVPSTGGSFFFFFFDNFHSMEGVGSLPEIGSVVFLSEAVRVPVPVEVIPSAWVSVTFCFVAVAVLRGIVSFWGPESWVSFFDFPRESFFCSCWAFFLMSFPEFLHWSGSQATPFLAHLSFPP